MSTESDDLCSALRPRLRARRAESATGDKGPGVGTGSGALFDPTDSDDWGVQEFSDVEASTHSGTGPEQQSATVLGKSIPDSQPNDWVDPRPSDGGLGVGGSSELNVPGLFDPDMGLPDYEDVSLAAPDNSGGSQSCPKWLAPP